MSCEKTERKNLDTIVENILLNELNIIKENIYFIKDKEIANLSIAGKPLISPIPINKEIFENNRHYLEYTDKNNKIFSAFSATLTFKTTYQISGIRLSNIISLRNKGILFFKFPLNNRLFVQYNGSLPRVTHLEELELFDKNKFYDYLKNVHNTIIKEACPEVTGLLLKNI